MTRGKGVLIAIMSFLIVIFAFVVPLALHWTNKVQASAEQQERVRYCPEGFKEVLPGTFDDGKSTVYIPTFVSADDWNARRRDWKDKMMHYADLVGYLSYKKNEWSARHPGKRVVDTEFIKGESYNALLPPIIAMVIHYEAAEE